MSGSTVPSTGGTLPPAPALPGGFPQPAPGINEPSGADIQPGGTIPSQNNNGTLNNPGGVIQPNTSGVGSGSSAVTPSTPNSQAPGTIETAPPLQGARPQ
jgi:hypothetical protein